MKGNEPLLLVEDDPVDVMTIKRAMKELNITNPVQVAGNGEEALVYLQDPQNEKPTLILLDLHMPRMDGISFLKEIKDDPVLKRIPVIVLTTSDEIQDKIESFDLSVAGYMLKPVNYQQFVEVIKAINLYWTLSEIPP